MKLWPKGKARVSIDTGIKSIEPANKANDRFAPMYAQIRRLTASVRDLENTVSILKRDVSRIDRKQYREAEASVPLSAKGPGNGQSSVRYL